MTRRRYEVIWEFDAMEQNSPLRPPLHVVPPVVIFADKSDPRVVRFTIEGVLTIWFVEHATFERCTRLSPFPADVG